MKKFIVINTTFEGIHCWPECPIDEVSFLRDPHRHIFHVTVKWPVNHNDRDKEFIVMKRKVDAWLKVLFPDKQMGRKSCEDVCQLIKDEFPDASFISVFEDGENGAEVHYG